MSHDDEDDNEESGVELPNGMVIHRVSSMEELQQILGQLMHPAEEMPQFEDLDALFSSKNISNIFSETASSHVH